MKSGRDWISVALLVIMAVEAACLLTGFFVPTKHLPDPITCSERIEDVTP